MQGPRSSALFLNHDSNCFPIVMNARFVVETEVMYQQYLQYNLMVDGLIVIVYPIVINIYFVLDTEGM